MLRTLWWVGYLFLYLFSRLPYAVKLNRLNRQGKTREAQALIDRQVSLWAQRLLRHIKIDVTVEGKENLPKPDEVVVYAANHQSFLDIPVLLANLEPPPPLLARIEIGQVPLLGMWMRRLGCVFVQREDARSGMQALREAQALVEGGRSLIIFPEGTRSKSDTLGKFQAGAVRVAAKAKAPVVPVAIDGTFHGFEEGGQRLRSAKVRLCILPRIDTASLNREEQKELPERIRADIEAAKDQHKAELKRA